LWPFGAPGLRFVGSARRQGNQHGKNQKDP